MRRKHAIKKNRLSPLPPVKVRRRPRSGSQVGSKRPGYIVGMGGSAGALEAFEQFFTHMPSDSGLAFVLVTHMDPAHKGMMP